MTVAPASAVVYESSDAVADAAAEWLAARAHQAVAARGRFTLAVSGGTTPWRMLQALSRLPLPWEAMHILQVDERVAPRDHADRNLTHIVASLRRGQDGPRIHPMPVDEADLDAACRRYEDVLRTWAATPPVLDVVHLGLGDDGHTASLVPGDPVLEVADRDVAMTDAYRGRRRMTLTYPILNRARDVLWLVTGAAKVAMLARLLARDAAIPAGRVSAARAVILADRAARPGDVRA